MKRTCAGSEIIALPRTVKAVTYSPNDPLLTLEEVGELLGTGPGLPAWLVESGQLDPIGQGDDVRVPRSQVIAYAVGLDSAPRGPVTVSATASAPGRSEGEVDR